MMPDPDRVLPDWLARGAESFPDRLAARCGGVSWSFADLDGEASRLARRLAAAGVAPGDRVAVLARNSLSFVALAHGVARLGAVIAPLNTRLTPVELAWQLADAGATLLVSDAAHAEQARSFGATLPDLRRTSLDRGGDGMALPDLPEADTPLRDTIDLSATQAIVYTSGTTGQPKGAIVTFGMQWWSAIGSALNLGHRDDDRWLAVLPFFHIGGLAMIWRGAIGGSGVVIHERFDPVAANDALMNDGVTLVSVVAVMLRRMLDALDVTSGGGRYLASLRCVLLGGGPAPLPLLEDCARRGIPVAQTYGMTESCSQAVTLAPADALRKLGSAGRPLMPVRVAIWRDGQPAAPGEAGEIMLRGPTITPGYINQPDVTAAALRDGWLATGDIGYRDAEGYLYLLDRRSDLIVSGGENVYPAEIEAVLLAHPAVAEAGVCGVDDAVWGEAPVALVRLREDHAATPDELRAFVAGRLARFKLPRDIVITEEPLPRNAAGKLLRREIPRLIARR